MRTKIWISIFGVMTTPSFLNTSRIQLEMSGCEKMVQMTSTRQDLTMVIGKQSCKLGQDGSVG